jgi:hypothetical protein
MKCVCEYNLTWQEQGMLCGKPIVFFLHQITNTLRAYCKYHHESLSNEIKNCKIGGKFGGG